MKNSWKIFTVGVVMLGLSSSITQAKMRAVDKDLINAVAKGNTKAIETALGSGANINFQSDDWGNHTPLMIAVFQNEPTVITLLISKGASLSIEDKFGHTALHIAQAHNLSKCITALEGKKI